jgi:hypothetical protein
MARKRTRGPQTEKKQNRLEKLRQTLIDDHGVPEDALDASPGLAKWIARYIKDSGADDYSYGYNDGSDPAPHATLNLVIDCEQWEGGQVDIGAQVYGTRQPKARAAYLLEVQNPMQWCEGRLYLDSKCHLDWRMFAMGQLPNAIDFTITRLGRSTWPRKHREGLARHIQDIMNDDDVEYFPVVFELTRNGLSVSLDFDSPPQEDPDLVVDEEEEDVFWRS